MPPCKKRILSERNAWKGDLIRAIRGQVNRAISCRKAAALQEEPMSVDTSQGNENMDYGAHEQSYNLFISIVQYGTAAVAIILIGMAVFLL
jgi:hypothetical protein